MLLYIGLGKPDWLICLRRSDFLHGKTGRTIVAGYGIESLPEKGAASLSMLALATPSITDPHDMGCDSERSFSGLSKRLDIPLRKVNDLESV